MTVHVLAGLAFSHSACLHPLSTSSLFPPQGTPTRNVSLRPPGLAVCPPPRSFFLSHSPSQDWLCATTVKQDLAMWESQLAKSRDVVVQSRAVAGLAQFCRSEEGWQAAFAALGACLSNKQVRLGCRMSVHEAREE